MKVFLVGLFLMFSSTGIWGQQLSVLTSLNDSLEESSGLIYLNQKLLTFNDSGGEPAIYEVDSTNGNIIRTVVLTNATNIDWEGICFDDDYIYVADIGNNAGSRTNLRVYRVLISDFFTTATDSIQADVISFNYADQSSFIPSLYTTNFDAEAIISVDTNLFIFTKNWGNQRSTIYPLSKNPGTYSLTKIDSFNAQGLITGASYLTNSSKIMLTGYALNSPFVIELSGYSFPSFSNGIVQKTNLIAPSGYSTQIESIAAINDFEFYLTAEKYTSSSALYKLIMPNSVNVEKVQLDSDTLYPNPSSHMVTIVSKDFASAEIYDLKGSFLSMYTINQIDVSGFSSGMYVLLIIDQTGFATRKMLVIK